MAQDQVMVQRMRWAVGMLAVVLAAVLSGRARAAQAQPRVIELFTSEGCSSCPPAEALLAQLATRPDVIALAFHVDYWDALGWRDRFALPLADIRQQRYASNLAQRAVYTPQFVIDGSTQWWPSRAGLPERPNRGGDAIPLRLSATGDAIQVSVGPIGRTRTACDVQLVSFTDKAVSVIGRGENAGRSVRAANLVRGILHLGAWSGEAREYTVARRSLPRDADHLAVLVQRDGQREIVAAAQFALPAGG